MNGSSIPPLEWQSNRFGNQYYAPREYPTTGYALNLYPNNYINQNITNNLIQNTTIIQITPQQNSTSQYFGAAENMVNGIQAQVEKLTSTNSFISASKSEFELFEQSLIVCSTFLNNLAKTNTGHNMAVINAKPMFEKKIYELEAKFKNNSENESKQRFNCLKSSILFLLKTILAQADQKIFKTSANMHLLEILMTLERNINAIIFNLPKVIQIEEFNIYSNPELISPLMFQNLPKPNFKQVSKTSPLQNNSIDLEKKQTELLNVKITKHANNTITDNRFTTNTSNETIITKPCSNVIDLIEDYYSNDSRDINQRIEPMFIDIEPSSIYSKLTCNKRKFIDLTESNEPIKKKLKINVFQAEEKNMDIDNDYKDVMASIDNAPNKLEENFCHHYPIISPGIAKVLNSLKNEYKSVPSIEGKKLIELENIITESTPTGLPPFLRLAELGDNIGKGVFYVGNEPIYKNKILGIYSGVYELESDNETSNTDTSYALTLLDNPICFSAAEHKAIFQGQRPFSKREGFEVFSNSLTQGNWTRYINHAYGKKSNVDWSLHRLETEVEGKLTSIFVQIISTTKKINNGQQILVNYGQSYWKNMKPNPVKPTPVSPNTYTFSDGAVHKKK